MITDHIRKKYDVQSELFGSRFVVKRDDGYHVARLSKGGSGFHSVKVGSTAYPELVKALRAIDAPISVKTSRSTNTLVAEFLTSHNGLLVSNVFNNAFVFTRVHPRHGWRFFIARLTDGGIAEDATIYASKDAALIVIGATGKPAHDLTGVPHWRDETLSKQV